MAGRQKNGVTEKWGVDRGGFLFQSSFCRPILLSTILHFFDHERRIRTVDIGPPLLFNGRQTNHLYGRSENETAIRSSRVLGACRGWWLGDGSVFQQVVSGSGRTQHGRGGRDGTQSWPQPGREFRQAAGGGRQVRLRYRPEPHRKRSEAAGRHGGQNAAGRRRLPPHPGRCRGRRPDLRCAEPLAWPGHDSGLRGGQARVCRKAVLPQSVRGRVDGPGSAEAQPRGTGGFTTSQWSRHDRSHPETARGHHRTCVSGAQLVQQSAAFDRQRQTGGGSRRAGLRIVARPRRPCALCRQSDPLQLALVLALGQRRTGQQRHPYAGPVPLGSGCRFPNSRDFLRRTLPLRRRPGDAGHANGLPGV